MKLLVILSLCALALAAPNVIKDDVQVVEQAEIVPYSPETTAEGRNILINALVRQMIAYIRLVINQGSSIFGIPPLDPLEIEHYHLYLPLGLINLDFEMADVRATGFGSFVDHTANLQIRDLTFEIDIGVPVIEIYAGKYDLVGDLLGAVPLYGSGQARFVIEGLRFRALLHLKQSDNERAIVIDRLENVSFEVPSVKSQLTGVIGGGDIDAIVNAVIEDVLIDYINRFQGALSRVIGAGVVAVLNPILDQLDTWRYIAPFV